MRMWIISYVWIELQDCEGILNMYEDKAVHVSVEGEGELLAVGSANPVTEEDFQRKIYIMARQGAGYSQEYRKSRNHKNISED